MMKQKVIKKSSLSEQICEILKDSIKSGKYKNGDKLPSEKELTEMYDVSRLTVRAAIQRLNAMGLVITKAGEGTFVKEFNLEKYLQEVSSNIVQPKMLNDIGDFRRLIDIECIRLAVQNATDEELQKLKDACEAYENLFDINSEMTDEKLKILAELDYKVHLTICELSKNSLYPMAYMAAQEIIKLYIYIIMESRYKRSKELGNMNTFIKAFRNHFAIYEAIKDRDFKRAKQITLNHIDYMVLALPPEEFN